MAIIIVLPQTADRLIRVALEPFRAVPDQAWLAAHLRDGSRALESLLDAEGLAPLWSDWIAESGLDTVADPNLVAAMRRLRHAGIARYLLQQRAATGVCERLATSGIRCALFKGAAIRQQLYRDPSLRPTADIDLLVGNADRDAAIRALRGAHFAFCGQSATISHEADLRNGPVTVDLHWRLFRPGRSRFELTPFLLETARPLDSLSVLNDDANLLVQLVHPAFAKHVNGRAARLIRVVDLDRMLRLIEPDWNWILPLIDAAGLRTAAWAVLYWTRLLLDTPVDPAVLRHLAPGRLKGRYLTYWIDRQLPARLGRIPGLVQGAFTLALHERPGDVVRALAQLGKARLESGRILRHLQRIAETSG